MQSGISRKLISVFLSGVLVLGTPARAVSGSEETYSDGYLQETVYTSSQTDSYIASSQTDGIPASSEEDGITMHSETGSYSVSSGHEDLTAISESIVLTQDTEEETEPDDETEAETDAAQSVLSGLTQETSGSQVVIGEDQSFVDILTVGNEVLTEADEEPFVVSGTDVGSAVVPADGIIAEDGIAAENEVAAENGIAAKNEVAAEDGIAAENEVAAKNEAAAAAETVNGTEEPVQTETGNAVELAIISDIEADEDTANTADAETVNGTGEPAQTETAAASESEAESENASETESGIAVEAETEIAAGTETETEITAGTETETEAVIETETEIAAGTETETEVAVETETETEETEEEYSTRTIRLRTGSTSVSVSGLMPGDVSGEASAEDEQEYSANIDGEGILAVDISLAREISTESESASSEAAQSEESIGNTGSGEAGEDTGSGEAGEDTGSGAAGEDTGSGAAGEDTGSGEAGEDTGSGEAGEDTESAVAGEDTESAVAGEDTESAVVGEDTESAGTTGSIESAGSADFTQSESLTDYQPENPMRVVIRDASIGEALENGAELEVWHIPDEGEAEKVEDARFVGNYAIFTADGFSVYLIIEHEGEEDVENARVEFHFIDPEYCDNTVSGYESLADGEYQASPYSFLNKAGTYQTTQIITDGESLEQIANPENRTVTDDEGNESVQYFFGWYVVSGSLSEDETSITYTWPDDPSVITFENAMSLDSSSGSAAAGSTITWTIQDASGEAELDEEGTAHVYLAPVYEDYYFVNFHLGTKDDESLSSSLIARELVVLGNDDEVTVRIGNREAPSTSATRYVFAGWESIDESGATAVYYNTVDSEGEERNYTKETDGTETESDGGYYAVFEEGDFTERTVSLYPVYDEARWIYFNTGISGNGASYVAARYRITNDDENGTYYETFPVSTRSGYEFVGWYADAVLDSSGNITNLTTAADVTVTYIDSAGETQSVTQSRTATKIVNSDGSLNTDIVDSNGTYTNSVTVDGTVYTRFTIEDGKFYVYKGLEQLTLYADWEAETVGYTVLFWIQNADDDDYNLGCYDNTLTATAGATITVSVDDDDNGQVTLASSSGDEKTYDVSENISDIEYFHINTYDTSVEVDGDGSTQINLYYDRNIYTLWFFLGRASGASLTDASTYTSAELSEFESGETVYGYVDGSYVALTEYTLDDGTTIYGYVDNDASEGTVYGSNGSTYSELEMTSETTTVYTADYIYSSTSENSNSTTYYGLVDGEYVSLIRSRGNYYYYTYSVSSSTSSGYYYILEDGEYTYTYLYRNNNGWYLSYSQRSDEYSDEYSGDVYDISYYSYNGNRYIRSTDGTTDVTDDLSLDTSELYYIDSNGGKVSVTASETTTVSYTLDGEEYNGDVIVAYSGTYYRLTATQKYSGGTYYVSTSGSTYNYKSTRGESAASGTNPFIDFYTNTGTTTISGTTYTDFYYSITDKYGADISDEWPDLSYMNNQGCGTFGSYTFISWIPSYGSSGSDNIKGIYYTMSSEIITQSGASVTDNDSTGGSVSGNTTSNVAHVLQGRFSSSGNYYAYYIYLAEDQSGEYPSDPTHIIYTKSQGGTSNQTVTPYAGYDYITRYDTSTYASYNGSSWQILKFYYQPHSGTVTLIDTMNSNKVLKTSTYYYNQSLSDVVDDVTLAEYTGYTFSGWYTNKDGVGDAFDFDTATMPDGNVALYAIYTPLKYVVKIDPNGGEIDHVNHTTYDNGGYYGYEGISPFRYDDSGYNKSQATYINAKYGTVISEYEIENNYVPMNDAAAQEYESAGGTVYYYLNTQRQDTDGSGLPSDLRNALYITEEEVDEYYEFYADWTQANLDGGYITETTVLGKSAWKNLYLSETKYRKAYSGEDHELLGWYQVYYDEDGNETGISTMPYNFATPVTGAFTLRAYWRLDAGYQLIYSPEYTMSDGTIINGDLEQWTDPAASGAKYVDGADTKILQQPTGLTANGTQTSEYTFRGWRLVSSDGTALEDEVYYDPGDAFSVDASYADSSGYIHMQAVYEETDSSYRRPYITNLTLDANIGSITLDGENELTENTDLTEGSEWDGIGTITACATDEDGADAERLEFGDIQSSAAIHLYRYATTLTTAGGESDGEALDPEGTNYFLHPDGYLLLGFDEESNEGDYLASYPADSVIAVTANDAQTLYAVWEPMVYISFVNDTGVGDVTFELSSSDSSALQVVNVKESLYERTALEDLGNITVADGESLTLAVPSGADQDIVISGTNSLGTGYMLTASSALNGETRTLTGTLTSSAEDYTEVKNGQEFGFSDTLVTDENGIEVTFTAQKNPHTLVLDDNYDGGTTQEIYFSKNADNLIYYGSENVTSYSLPTTTTRIGYEFAGWATSSDASSASYSTDNWDIADLNAFFTSDGEDSTDPDLDVVTLYAVWEVNVDASIVYVYKNVPTPGNQDQEFTFTVAFGGTYTYDYYSGGSWKTSTVQDISEVSDEYTLSHGQYLKITSTKHVGDDSTQSYLQMLVQKYNADGKQDGSDSILSWTWDGWSADSSNKRPYITFQSQSLSVTEDDYSSSYYDTALEISGSTETYVLSKGSSTSDSSDSSDSDRVLSWSDTDAGGTAVFTNTRQTQDITISKELVSNTTGSTAFSFLASYTNTEDINGSSVTTESSWDTFTVSSGSSAVLEDIPVGAELMVTETGTDLYDYSTSAVWNSDTTTDETALTLTETSETADSVTTINRSVAMTVPDEDNGIITFTNTLKSYPVTMYKVDQDSNAGVEAFFKLTADTGTVGQQMYPDQSTGIFYTEDEFYVGEYTLTETFTEEGYEGLTGDVTLKVSGENDGTITAVTEEGDEAKVVVSGNADDGFEVYIYNVQTIELSIAKVLSDPLITSTRTFYFALSYDYTLNSVSNSVDLSGDDAIAVVSGTSETVTVPVGAENLTIAEETARTASTSTTIAETYDTTVQLTPSGEDAEEALESDSYTYETAVTAENDGDLLTFTNTKKTVDITVGKVVENSEDDNSFTFTATLKGNTLITDYTVYEDTVYEGDEAIVTTLTTDSNGQVTFELKDGDSTVLTIPVGTNLVLQETGMTLAEDASDTDITLSDYTTTVEAVETADSADTSDDDSTVSDTTDDSTSDNTSTDDDTTDADTSDSDSTDSDASASGTVYSDGTYDEDSKTYTISSVPGTAITVTFTNSVQSANSTRRVILRKTDTTGNSLAGARFRIFTSGCKEVTDGQADGTGYYESDDSGVYFCGALELGTYYIVETEAPDGYTAKTYELTVDEDSTDTSGNVVYGVQAQEETDTDILAQLQEAMET